MLTFSQRSIKEKVTILPEVVFSLNGVVLVWKFVSQEVMEAPLSRASTDALHVLANDPQPEVFMSLLVAHQPSNHEVQQVQGRWAGFKAGAYDPGTLITTGFIFGRMPWDPLFDNDNAMRRYHLSRFNL